jgi:hypothetical protein
MPHRRTIKKGSFAGHFDDLVTHFADADTNPKGRRGGRNRKLQEKIDIHAALFEQAWQLERRSS